MDPDSVDVRNKIGKKIWKHLTEVPGAFQMGNRNDSCVDGWIAAKFLGWTREDLGNAIKDYLLEIANKRMHNDHEATQLVWVASMMNALEEHLDRIENYAEMWDEQGILLDKMIDSCFAGKLKSYVELIGDDE